MDAEKKIVLDCSLWQKKDEVHRAFREALSFPAYYGNNLDALHDMLTTLTGIDLTVDHSSVLQERFGAWGKNLQRVLLDSAHENPGLRIMLRP